MLFDKHYEKMEENTGSQYIVVMDLAFFPICSASENRCIGQLKEN